MGTLVVMTDSEVMSIKNSIKKLGQVNTQTEWVGAYLSARRTRLVSGRIQRRLAPQPTQ